MITRAIRNALKRKEEKNWEKTYWAFDIHETMILPNWKIAKVPLQLYPHVLEVLHMLSGREDIVLFLYTCSHPPEITVYLDFFKEQGIHFAFVNENPEVINFKYGNYDKKPYFNVLFEDKAGFDPYEDWILVKELLIELGFNQTSETIAP